MCNVVLHHLHCCDVCVRSVMLRRHCICNRWHRQISCVSQSTIWSCYLDGYVQVFCKISEAPMMGLTCFVTLG